MAAHQKSKFDEFDRTDHVYSTVNCHDILVSIFRPSDPAIEHPHGSSVKGPVLVYWHGGGFIVGDRLYEPWWPDWLLGFAQSHNATIVAPNYRLLPEASGADIMDDMDSFWTWMLTTLPNMADSESWPTQPDMGRIICAGHSAGGAMALISALERPDAAIKAVLSLYGPLCPDVPGLKMAQPRSILGSLPIPPRQAEADIRKYVQGSKGTIRTQGDVLEMWGLVACIIQQGKLPRMMNRTPDARLNPTARMETTKTCPPIWVVHGREDSVVSSMNNSHVRRALSNHYE
ncbi:hypothetical protein ACHAPU_008457 [Fusarium lateritium]